MVGEAPELQDYFVAAGLNSIGILTGGGLGRVLAHWIVHGSADVDVTGFNIDRLHTYQANPEYRRTRTVESLGLVYKCHYPWMSLTTARGVQPLALSRTPRQCRCLLQGSERLGESRLVRRAGGDARSGTAHLGPARAGSGAGRKSTVLRARA